MNGTRIALYTIAVVSVLSFMSTCSHPSSQVVYMQAPTPVAVRIVQAPAPQLVQQVAQPPAPAYYPPMEPVPVQQDMIVQQAPSMAPVVIIGSPYRSAYLYRSPLIYGRAPIYRRPMSVYRNHAVAVRRH